MLSGGTGDDQFTYSDAAQLVAGVALVDSIVGGEGSDSIVLTGNVAYNVANTVSFARAQSVESIVTVGTNTSAVSLTLGATAFTSGIRNIDLSSAGTAGARTINVAAAVAGQNLSLTGSAGSDGITGGAGNDTITGGAGADTLTGALGADRFVQNAGSTANATAGGTVGSAGAFNEFLNGETLIMGAGLASFDIITDFVAGLDTIRLGTGAVLATLLSGTAGTSAITTAGNFGIRGDLAGDTFTANATGVSTLLLTSTAALANDEATSLGTNFTVLQNTVLTQAQLTAAVVA